jgi:N-acetyl sugar amidotransferase
LLDNPIRRNLRLCARCVYDERVPSITFDDDAVCNYCKMHDDLDRRYPTGVEGEKILSGIVEQIKRAGRGKKYDCIVGVSGGCDSSFMLHKAVEMGLRPLAVHFDNTWNSPTATQNIYNVLDAMGVDLWTLVVDNKEYNDICRAFLSAGLPDADGPTDIALTTTLYMAAAKYGVRYILEGHSFRTEGISPLGWLYMDGKYVESVHRRFGRMPMRSYPNLTLWRFINWAALKNIKRIRPLWYLPYNKEEAKALLKSCYGWKWYGGHHLENRYTAFHHSYFTPRRYGTDLRALGYAALVRSGQLDRDVALRQLGEPHDCPLEIVDMVKKRLGFTDDEFERVMNLPMATWRDFETYKPAFEQLRPFFWVLMKFNRVPESFYMKFCRPLNDLRSG